MFSLKCGLYLPNNLANHLVIFGRSYRFGRRGIPGGFYVSPKWFDQRLLKETKPSSILNEDSKVRLQNRLFDEEITRQKSLINRVEKIEILLEKPFPKGQDNVLMMNAGTSTPYDCTQHINEMITKRSALALVDGKQYLHMHQPLNKSCHLRLLHFKSDRVMPVNKAFWRSCSMLLASVINSSFKNEHSVEIISPLLSDVKSGSFICDAKISSLPGWNPTQDEKRILTSLIWEEASKNLVYERLEVNKETAKKLFIDSISHLERLEQLPNDQIVLYRLGNYIDICQEPLISRTSQIGSIFLSAIHPIKTSAGKFYRFQGIAMPLQLYINPYVYSLIRERSCRLNSTGLD